VIGATSVIGGSCWITHSIPPDTTVMLHEPRMKYRGPGAQALLPTEPEWMI
jgi:serine O-acetyltransferase